MQMPGWYYELKYMLYYSPASYLRKLRVAATMLLKREKRLYYLYSTGQVIQVTAFNYMSKVKVDVDEFAIVETINRNGERSWSKGERF